MIQAPSVSTSSASADGAIKRVRDAVSGSQSVGTRGKAMYDVISLSCQDGSVESHVVAINDAGVGCGSRSTRDGRLVPALWSPNGLARLLECGRYGGMALAINSRGVAVGYEYTSQRYDQRQAIAWVNGERIVLPGVGSADTRSDDVAAAINGDGLIGGRSNGRYVLWSLAGSGQIESHELPAGFSSYFGPNENGMVAGRIGLPEQGEPQKLGFWFDGSIATRDFPNIAGTWRYYVTGINGHDQVLVTGSDEQYDDLGWFGILADRREIVVDRRRNGLKLIAHDLNDAGVVVGRAEVENSAGFPFIWSAGQPVDLNRLISCDSSFTVFAATAVNNHGMILAHADDSNGTEHQVLLMPTQQCRRGHDSSR